MDIDQNQPNGAGNHSQFESALFPVAKVGRILKAVERTAGVRVGLLDELGAPSEFDEAGVLVADKSSRVLPAVILQAAERSVRPVLHPATTGGVEVSVPFLAAGQTIGFVTSWCFCLAQLEDAQRAAVEQRFIVDASPKTFTQDPSLPQFDYERFSVLADLLEAAAAQITLIVTTTWKGSTLGRMPRPLTAAMFSALEELSTATRSGQEVEEAIKARERLEAIYNSTQDAILMLDKELRIVAANKEFGRIFGTEGEAFVGVTGTWLRRWLIKNAKDPARVSTMIDELLANPRAILDDEVELLSPRYMILRFYSAPVTDKTGENIGRLLAFRDITQFRKARQQVIGNEKMTLLGSVAAGLAHELNNILAGMVTYADYALEEGDSDKIREALKMSISSAEKANELVQKFLSVTGPAESQRQDVDLHLELERLLDTVEVKFRLDNVRIHRLLEAVPRVHIDPIQIQQVLHHILDNAKEAIGSEGIINVSTQTDWDRGTVRVIVTDSGGGIAPESIDRIFDPFFTTKGVVVGGGSTRSKGLGLSIAKGIVEAHGGKIYAGNVLPHGASIVVELPLAGSPTERPPSPSVY
jgi:PAS domain S-box-containing protein